MSNVLSLLPALFILTLACVVGILLTRLLPITSSVRLRLGAGITIGLALLAWVGMLFALTFGLTTTTIYLTIGFFVLATILLRRQILACWSERKIFSLSGAALLTFAAWAIFFIFLFSRVIQIEAAGLYTAPANNYGDLAFHFSVVTGFADGNNFPPQNPIFHGLQFTYPFLIDFLTAFLHRAGASWAAAFFLPHVLLALALLLLLELLTLRLTANPVAARLTPLIFFFSGGLGFIYCWRDYAQTGQSLWDFLTALPQMYTKNDALQLQWGNALTTLLVPQRSLLFGAPFFALIVLLWWEYCSADKSDPPTLRRTALLAAGILAGVMPLLHAHGFFSVMLVSGPLALLFLDWQWRWFFIPAGLLALPQALWLSATGTKSSLFKPHFGWASGDAPLLKFFILNFGVALTLLCLALIFQTQRVRRFYLPFLLCFIVPNVVLLAPWPWDNIKVLFYWHLISAVLVAGLLAACWQKKWLAPLALLLLGALTLSGLLDVTRGLSRVERLLLFEQEKLTVAAALKQQLPERALVLCAPIHNSVLALAGRQMLMGYPGHLWSHGIAFESREADVKTMLSGGTDALQLLRQYDIDYAIIGPVEYSEYDADEGFFAENFPVVIENSGYRIYKIKS